MARRKKRDPWKSFRAEMIERDGAACVRCSKRKRDGAVLQVHHKAYIPGRERWEYRYDQCELLCKACHAAEHGIIPPRTGWEYLGDEDLEDLSGTCENCGTEIRYAFHIRHDKWPDMSVGTDCCDNLTGTVLASNHIESTVRFRRRKENFIYSKRWEVNRNGQHYIRQKGMEIVIGPESLKYKIWVNGWSGKRRFASLEDSKAALFEGIENGSIEKFLARMRTAAKKEADSM